MKKKILSIIISIFTLLPLCFSTVACGENNSDEENIEPQEHIHTYSERSWNYKTHRLVTNCKDHEILVFDGEHEYDYENGNVIIEPTCTVKGKIIYACKICGFDEHEEYPIKEHNYVKIKTYRYPTCSQVGLDLYECSNCRKEKQLEIDKTSHTIGGLYVSLDYHYNKCNECGASINTIGHKFDSRYVCTDCDFVASYSTGLSYDYFNPQTSSGKSQLTITGFNGTSESFNLIFPSHIQLNAYSGFLPITSVKERAFEKNQSIESVVISNTIKNIYSSAFDTCHNLKNIDFGKTEYIGSMAFNMCDSLEYVIFGKELKSIGSYSFGGCTGLKAIYYKGTKSDWGKISIYSKFYDIIDTLNVKICYYSETKLNDNDCYWHYENNIPTIWR